MSIKLLLICILLAGLPVSYAASGDQLIPVLKDAYWGYVDSDGKTVITPAFAWARKFSEGLAVVAYNGRWAYIDADGIVKIQGDFERASDFADGMASVRVNGNWGYIDKQGRMVIEPKYEIPGDFVDGIASVRPSGERFFEYIDKAGNTILTTEVDCGADDFSEGLVALKLGGKYRYVDAEGQTMIQGPFQAARPFSGGLAAVMSDRKWSVIDSNGKVMYRVAFPARHISGFHEGFAKVSLENGYSFMDVEGNLIGDSRYMAAGDFSEGLAAVKIDDAWGYIDKKGKLAIKPQFRVAGPFQNGAARVDWKDRSGYINRKGEPVATFTYLSSENHRVTMQRMIDFATALWSFWKANGKLPEEGNVLAELKSVEESEVSIVDAWNMPFAYRLTDKGAIRVLSGGSDRTFQPGSWLREGGSSDPAEDLQLEKTETGYRQIKYFAEDKCDCEIFCLSIGATVQ